MNDLCVTLETATPDEIKSGGAGWSIQYGIGKTPFGVALVGLSPRGICRLSFLEDPAPLPARAILAAAWPQARLQRDDRAVRQILAQIFGQPAVGTTPLTQRILVKVSAFQIRVWQALLRIPSGTLTTYGQLAAQVGQPKAARAVGTAVGNNPVACLIPCHRVIRQNGLLGGYRWGTARKQAMITLECKRAEAASGPSPRKT